MEGGKFKKSSPASLSRSSPGPRHLPLNAELQCLSSTEGVHIPLPHALCLRQGSHSQKHRRSLLVEEILFF